jgi:hypothetical protein
MSMAPPVAKSLRPHASQLGPLFLAGALLRVVDCQPIRRADAARPLLARCARRLTDGFKRHWLSPGHVPGAFFDWPAAMLAPCRFYIAQRRKSVDDAAARLA